IDIVGADQLPGMKARRSTGPPACAAVVAGKLYFAPEPDGTYNAMLSYYLRVPTLTGAAPTNWLLTSHPDIYRLAALAESAPYLKEDERLATWEAMLNARLEDLLLSSQQEAYSGSLTRTARPLGE